MALIITQNWSNVLSFKEDVTHHNYINRNYSLHHFDMPAISMVRHYSVVFLQPVVNCDAGGIWTVYWCVGSFRICDSWSCCSKFFASEIWKLFHWKLDRLADIEDNMFRSVLRRLWDTVCPLLFELALCACCLISILNISSLFSKIAEICFDKDVTDEGFSWIFP